MDEKTEILREIKRLEEKIEECENQMKENSSEVKKLEKVMDKANEQRREIENRIDRYIGAVEKKSNRLSKHNKMHTVFVRQIRKVLLGDNTQNAIAELDQIIKKANQGIYNSEENSQKSKNSISVMEQEILMLKRQIES